MALTFPAGPTAGQQYTGPNGIVYQWDSAVGVWNKVNAVQTATAGATAATGAARIPAGNTAARPAATLAAGLFRFNSQIPQLEYSDGTSWLPVGGGGGTAATLPEAQAGTLNTVFSSPLTSVPKDASGMTGSAYIPAGTTLQRPTATNYTGQFRYNTTIPQLEYSDGTTWVAVVPPGGGVTSFSAGTTGLTPAAATSGAVTLGGTLAVANGGTGATTQAAALTNLLPSQTGNTGKVLSTDGTNASWATAGGGAVTKIIAGTGMGVSPTTGIGDVTITSLGSLTVFSNFSADSGGFTDTPVDPGFTIRNTLTIPAGYTNFLVYSSVAFYFQYDTTSGATVPYNMVFQNTASWDWLTSLGYQAAVVSPNVNNGGTLLSTSVFISATSSKTASNTFNQVITKRNPHGPVFPQDSSLLVLAYTL